jgi:rhodanese-related sulfurtransferase
MIKVEMSKAMTRTMNNGSFKNITVAELDAMLQQGSLRLVDVRTDAEMARGVIPQGEPLPLHLIPMRLGEMDKRATTVFYCQVGGRSARAAAIAAANGFADVYNLQGGIAAWMSAGLPVRS